MEGLPPVQNHGVKRAQTRETPIFFDGMSGLWEVIAFCYYKALYTACIVQTHDQKVPGSAVSNSRSHVILCAAWRNTIRRILTG